MTLRRIVGRDCIIFAGNKGTKATQHVGRFFKVTTSKANRHVYPELY